MFSHGNRAEVIPVVKLDGREIADGKPGPVTNRVLAEFRRRVFIEGTRSKPSVKNPGASRKRGGRGSCRAGTFGHRRGRRSLALQSMRNDE